MHRHVFFVFFATAVLFAPIASTAADHPMATHGREAEANSLRAGGRGPGATVLHTFEGGTDGAAPSMGLVLDQSGTLFGATAYGGSLKRNGSGCGQVYALKLVGSVYQKTVVYNFKCTPDAENPSGALALASSGDIFGTTTSGGLDCPNPCGTVFRLRPAGKKYTEVLLYRFTGGSDGAVPISGITLGGDGSLYGTTLSGGGFTSCGEFWQCGTVFKLTANGSKYTESVLYSFQGGKTDGAHPVGAVTVDASGTIFGATVEGGGGKCKKGPRGAIGCGTIFSLVPTGSGYREQLIYRFQGDNDGSFPQGDLTPDGSGGFYGSTLGGGAHCPFGGCGTIFRLVPAGSGAYSETVLFRFTGRKTGFWPNGGLVLGPSGELYGTTNRGGALCPTDEGRGCGVVFELVPGSPTYTELVLDRLDGTEGALPFSGLVRDASGSLFGTAGFGGDPACNCGTAFRVTP